MLKYLIGNIGLKNTSEVELLRKKNLIYFFLVLHHQRKETFFLPPCSEEEKNSSVFLKPEQVCVYGRKEQNILFQIQRMNLSSIGQEGRG